MRHRHSATIFENAFLPSAWRDLRHTWAAWMAQAGVPELVLQRLGGCLLTRKARKVWGGRWDSNPQQPESQARPNLRPCLEMFPKSGA